MTATPLAAAQQFASGYPAPFGGPTSGAAAAYGLTRSPFAQRGLPPPGYSGYGAGFDPELMRLLNGVHEATRALDDYLRFRGYI